MARPALLRRFPVRPPGGSQPPLPSQAAAEFPALGAVLETLEQELFPVFTQFDVAAQRSQYGYRLAQVLLIVGGFSATVLGAVQAALRHAAWAGVVEAVVLVALGVIFQLTGELNFKADYLETRLKAERLRAECFLYLGRVGEYRDLDPDVARRVLRRHVALIKTGRSSHG